MKHLPLKIMLNAEVKIKRAEGKISGTLSTMMRFTQDQRREAAEEQEAATVVERGVADSMLTLEMNTTKGRHQCIMIPGMKELAKIDIRDPNPEVLIDMKRIEEEMEGEEYPLQNSAIQEDLPQCQWEEAHKVKDTTSSADTTKTTMTITIMVTRITMADHKWIDSAEDLAEWVHQLDTTSKVNTLNTESQVDLREEVVPQEDQQEVDHIPEKWEDHHKICTTLRVDHHSEGIEAELRVQAWEVGLKGLEEATQQICNHETIAQTVITCLQEWEEEEVEVALPEVETKISEVDSEEEQNPSAVIEAAVEAEVLHLIEVCSQAEEEAETSLDKRKNLQRFTRDLVEVIQMLANENWWKYI